MYNDSTKQSLEYEIVISKEKGKFTAYSHTWYVVDDKKFYSIKKINVRVAKDGKIIMQDAKIIEYNYPGPVNKNVIQLNILDLANICDEASLDGEFVTNRSRSYLSLTGHISIKRVNPLTPSDLVKYLQKSSIDNNFTAVK
jgi:predicted ABC-type ATPase